MIRKITICLITAFFLLSCGGKEKKKLAFYDNDTPIENDSVPNNDYDYSTSDYEDYDDSNIVAIPFEEKGGVKFVDVSVNGFGFQMIFDTGCSSTLISVAEARYLYEKGYLTSEDILGVTQSQIADGSIVENMVINLKEVVLGDKIRCTDVQATVSSNNNAPLLLGNEILNRAAAYAVDNENQVINFKIK